MAAVPAITMAALMAAALVTSQYVTMATAAVSAAPMREQTSVNTFRVIVLFWIGYNSRSSSSYIFCMISLSLFGGSDEKRAVSRS